ncbi:ATP-binding protein [Catenulispora sp. NL8]|uniref:ATP-binding protein n=1 Tax=Catenulispora pinistramenti TaxID=2705254 RepID=A0ABS5KHB7_9ACTN|nr:ATP-binding protein [Catenulispora pinistramenti]MBS2545503.1 ATP-binding protein [Catenulispora pinistramenti]
MRGSLTCPGHAEHLSDVRKFILKVLGDVPGVDVAELVASELAGNAIVHSASGGPGGSFTLHVEVLADRWLIRVDDAGGVTEPRVRCADSGKDESGRGLALVSAVSLEWGVVGGCDARSVWAAVPIPVRPQSELSLASLAT